MERAIAHMDLDTFFVSCERLKNSVLEKQPVIIGVETVVWWHHAPMRFVSLEFVRRCR